jgi:hypothetical protein
MEEKIETEWSKRSKEADKFNPLRIGDPCSKVFERAPVHFRDDPTVTATMLESQRNIHERK